MAAVAAILVTLAANRPIPAIRVTVLRAVGRAFGAFQVRGGRASYPGLVLNWFDLRLDPTFMTRTGVG